MQLVTTEHIVAQKLNWASNVMIPEQDVDATIERVGLVVR